MPNVAAWEEFRHNWLDVEDRCSVDGIQFGDEQPGAVHPDDSADGAPDAVGPIPTSLRENADTRPNLVIARMTRAGGVSRLR